MALSQAPSAAVGRVFESQTQPGVRYCLERLLGVGGMGSAYLARRDAPEGASVVVVKLVNHGLGARVAPELLAMKEAVALGRLNQRVPPTPFVVRFVDTGSTPIFGSTETPWTAIEYVHGGIEGTSLEDRVSYSVHKTGYAFDPRRAAHALRCLAAGLGVIFEVGVIHRDLSPSNVLCCGFGETEIFKIADFGISRASGLEPTFQGTLLGTLGYSAPEAQLPSAGPTSDIFSLATLVYYVLTGQHYFDVSNPMEAMQHFASDARSRITDNAALVPELLDRPEACREIDRALARATALSPKDRPQSAAQFAAGVLPWLGEGHDVGPRSSNRLLHAVQESSAAAPAGELSFIIKHQGSDELLITGAAWDTDGHALVLSTQGPRFWNGDAFLDAAQLLKDLPGQPTFVQRYAAGGWLLGGGGSALVVIDPSGVRERLDAPQADICFDQASGRLDDLLVATGTRAGEQTLFAICGRRWLKSIPLPGVTSITTLQRLDDSRWLIAGRMRDEGGFAAVYAPLQVEARKLAIPKLRAVIGGASAAERSVALLVGSEGVAMRFDGDAQSVSLLPGAPDLSAAALDVLNREWVATLGALWTRDARKAEAWKAAWHAPSWKAPFVSLIADAGIVMGMTADGAIVEGRASSKVA